MPHESNGAIPGQPVAETGKETVNEQENQPRTWEEISDNEKVRIAEYFKSLKEIYRKQADALEKRDWNSYNELIPELHKLNDSAPTKTLKPEEVDLSFDTPEYVVLKQEWDRVAAYFDEEENFIDQEPEEAKASQENIGTATNPSSVEGGNTATQEPVESKVDAQQKESSDAKDPEAGKKEAPAKLSVEEKLSQVSVTQSDAKYKSSDSLSEMTGNQLMEMAVDENADKVWRDAAIKEMTRRMQDREAVAKGEGKDDPQVATQRKIIERHQRMLEGATERKSHEKQGSRIETPKAEKVHRLRKTEVEELWTQAEKRGRQNDSGRKKAIQSLREYYEGQLRGSGQLNSEMRAKFNGSMIKLEVLERFPQSYREDFRSPSQKPGGGKVKITLVEGRSFNLKPENEKSWRSVVLYGIEMGVAPDEMNNKTLAELHEMMEKREYRAYQETIKFAEVGASEGEMKTKFRSWARRPRTPVYVDRKVSRYELLRSCEQFWKDIKEQPQKYEHPLKKSFREAATEIMGIGDDLKGLKGVERDEKFRGLVRENFADYIAYSVKDLKGDIKPGTRTGAGRDADVRALLWAAREAGIQRVEERAVAVPQGSRVLQKFNLDTSGASEGKGITGLQLIRVKGKQGEEVVLAAADNHHKGMVYPTSAAKIFYTALDQNGFFNEKKDQARRWEWIGRMIVEHTVNDDNAIIPSLDRNEETDQKSQGEVFTKSAKTMNGLAYAMNPNDMYGAFAKYMNVKGVDTRQLDEQNWHQYFVGAMNTPMGPETLNEFRLDKRWVSVDKEVRQKYQKALGKMKKEDKDTLDEFQKFLKKEYTSKEEDADNSDKALTRRFLLDYEMRGKDKRSVYDDLKAISAGKVTIKKTGKKEYWSPTERAQQGLEQAEKILGVGEEELRKEGRIIDIPRSGKNGKLVRNDKYFVHVIYDEKDKLLSGHKAVKAYGYQGYLSIKLTDPHLDPRKISFLFNTLVSREDLSRNKALDKLMEKGGVLVRGKLALKNREVERCYITMTELLETQGLHASNIIGKHPGSELAKVLLAERKAEVALRDAISQGYPNEGDTEKKRIFEESQDLYFDLIQQARQRYARAA